MACLLYSPMISGIVSKFAMPRFKMSGGLRGNSFRFSLLAMFLVQSHLFVAILAQVPRVVNPQHSQCNAPINSLNQDWVVTAPARFVPAPPVDPSVQAEFFRLFTSDNYTKAAVANEALPPGMSQEDLDFIASVCPKTAFFYSMSPQHIIARDMLQRYLEAQPTPREVVRVARIILHNHEINPKIWYYALMGAMVGRPDTAVYTIPQPLDAMPDLFVPAPIISEALSRYSGFYGIGNNFINTAGAKKRRQGRRGDKGLNAFAKGLLNSGGLGSGLVGGFVPSLGPSGRSRAFINEDPSSRIAGLAPLSDVDTGSFQTFNGVPLTAASQVREQRVRFNSGDKFGYSFNYTTGDEDDSQVDFQRRRGSIMRKRVKVSRRQDNRQLRRRTTTADPLEEDDHAGAESIASGHAVLPPPSYTARTGAGVRRNMNYLKDDFDHYPSNHSDIGNPAEEAYYQQTLAYGEEDDEFDELLRIHETSNNSTRDIRQRILQRRQRRKNTRTETPSKKVKRQVYNYGSPSFPQFPKSGDCIVINGTIGTDNGVENKLWYFREDIMMNQFHWYWHQMYPINSTRHADRRAELFFFVHRNIVARYNAERLSNGLPRTRELVIRHGSFIEDGYDPHLIDMNSKKLWTPRQPHQGLTDILHEQDQDFARNIFLKDVYDLYHKLIYSIKDGHLVGPNLESIPIKHARGIDTLANTVEASDISVNPLYYDSMGVHNLGHQVLGLAQDPQFIAQLPTGVMADTAVTMRDPVFYTFHSGIDNLFDRHKRTLPPYQLHDGDFPLIWQGVAISSVEVVSSYSDGHPNLLRTFFSRDRFPLEGGLDGSIHNGQVREDICSVHLNHEPFTFKLTVNVNPCVQTISRQGTIRIFMAPRFDEYGQRFPLKVQRRLMIQLDSFPVQLQQGRNVILRRSEDSALTKPWMPSLRELTVGGRPAGGSPGASPQQGAANFCGCGWPSHLYIPKGNQQGMPFDLFVMITNFDEDNVQDNLDDVNDPEPCSSPHIFCGVPFRKYPDARPMGYPFDRLPYKKPIRCNEVTSYPNVVCKMLHPEWHKTVETLEEYVHPVPNMATRVVVIKHLETLVN